MAELPPELRDALTMALSRWGPRVATPIVDDLVPAITELLCDARRDALLEAGEAWMNETEREWIPVRQWLRNRAGVDSA